MLDLDKIKGRCEKVDEFKKKHPWSWSNIIPKRLAIAAFEDRVKLVAEVELQRRILQYAYNVIAEKQDGVARMSEQLVRCSNRYNRLRDEGKIEETSG